MQQTAHTDSDPQVDGDTATAAPPLTAIQIIGSTLAAGFGVQSRKNKIRDFEQGKPGHFIAAGLIFTGLFLGGLITLVNMITGS
jgi:hypothetical protein